MHRPAQPFQPAPSAQLAGAIKTGACTKRTPLASQRATRPAVGRTAGGGVVHHPGAGPQPACQRLEHGIDRGDVGQREVDALGPLHGLRHGGAGGDATRGVVGGQRLRLGRYGPPRGGSGPITPTTEGPGKENARTPTVDPKVTECRRKAAMPGLLSFSATRQHPISGVGSTLLPPPRCFSNHRFGATVP